MMLLMARFDDGAPHGVVDDHQGDDGDGVAYAFSRSQLSSPRHKEKYIWRDVQQNPLHQTSSLTFRTARIAFRPPPFQVGPC